MITNLKCPCGDFRPGDPSDAHSVRHTAWLHRNDPAPVMPGGESTSALLRRAEGERDAIGVKLVEALAQARAAQHDRNEMYQALYAATWERDTAREDLHRAEEHQEIRARALREKNAKLREVEHLLGIDMCIPPRDVADAVRDLLAEVARRGEYAKNLGELSCPDPAAHQPTEGGTDV